MKLLIGLSLVACVYAAKLDRAYLPPASAGTAGGSPGSLNAPAGPIGSTGFGQSSPAFGQNGASNGGFGKTSGPAFGQQSAPSGVYGQPGSQGQNLDAGFSQPASNFRGQGTQGFGGQGAQGFGGQGAQGIGGQGAQGFEGQGAQGFGDQGAQNYQRNQPQRSQAAAEQAAEILRYDSQNDGETFSYSFETSNGISAEESGVATNGVQAQGAFSYSDDDGQAYRVTYTADENGYQPQGDHLPTPHPIPEEILRSIEKNAQAAAAGTQEGAYNPDEDNSASGFQQYSSNAPNSYGQGASGAFNQQGGAPSKFYGAPNAGGAASRPQSGQGFQQSPSQQYGAPNGASSGRPSNAQPSQLYGSPSNDADSFGNGGQAKPNNFGQNQPQGPSQQYGAPSRPGASAPSGPANIGFGASGSSSTSGFGPNSAQTRPNQYQASPSSAGRPQGFAQNGQAQDGSGYQYDRPQGSSFGQASNGNPSTQGSAQYRPQNGGASGSFPKPNGNNGYGSGPQGSFGSPSGPSQSQSASGPSAGFGPSASKGPTSIGSAGSAGQGSYGSPSSTNFGAAGSNGGSSFGPSSRGPSSNGANGKPQGNGFSGGNGGSSGYNYERPQSGRIQGQSGNGAPSSAGSEFGGPRQPPSFSEQDGYKY